MMYGLKNSDLNREGSRISINQLNKWIDDIENNMKTLQKDNFKSSNNLNTIFPKLESFKTNEVKPIMTFTKKSEPNNELITIKKELEELKQKYLILEQYVNELRKKREFIPFFVKESFIEKSNYCFLIDNHLEFKVEIKSSYYGPAIIYPFGSERYLPRFNDLQLTIAIISNDEKSNNTIEGLFQRDSTGLYSITLSSSINSYSFPLILSYNGYLELN